jgi:hypothetical protein
MPFRYHPFGPIDASDFRTTEALNENYIQINSELNNKLRHASVIIGRRGSGKTTFLAKIDSFHKEFSDVKSYIKSNKEITCVAEAIFSLSDHGRDIETVAEIWEGIVWRYFFIAFKNKLEKNKSIKRTSQDRFLVAYAIALEKEFDLATFVSKLATALSKSNGLFNILSSELLKSLDLKKVTFGEAKNMLVESLKEKNMGASLCIDSLEDFRVRNKDRLFAITSLVYLISAFNARVEKLKVVFCCPTEIYPLIKKECPAPGKAFRYSTHLRWSAEELLVIAGTRLARFLDNNGSKTTWINDSIYPSGKVSNVINNSEDAKTLISAFAPTTIRELNGAEMELFASILRRTQLAPRQIIRIFNEIFDFGLYTKEQVSNLEYKSWKLEVRSELRMEKMKKENVFHGLLEASKKNCDDVIHSYSTYYPFIEELCSKVLSKISPIIDYNNLMDILSKYIDKISDLKGYDADKLVNLLYEIGAIGIVEGDNTYDLEKHQVIRADFSYIHRELNYAPDDCQYCVHPMFEDVFNRKSRSNKLIVFPIGCYPKDEDYRFS